MENNEDELITIEEFISELVRDFESSEDNIFIYDNIFYKLLVKFEKVIWPTIDNYCEYYDLIDFKNMSYKNLCETIKDFYKSIGIDYSVLKAKSEAEVIVKHHDIKNAISYIGEKTHGEVFVDDTGKKCLYVTNNKLSIDSIIMLHELTHLRNEPVKERSFLNLILSESLSYVMEEIYCDYLEEKGYTEDVFNYRLYRNRSVYLEIVHAIDIIKMYILSIKKGVINETSYKELYDDDLFEFILDDIEKTVIVDETYMYSYIFHAVGYIFGILLYNRCLNNANYLEELEKLNICLKEGISFKNTLKILDIDLDSEMFFEEINESINKYIEKISRFNNNEYVLKKIKEVAHDVR